MTEKEFVKMMVGKPYVNRGYSIFGCDCFGLVYLYLFHVKNQLPKLTDEYLNGSDFEEAFYSVLNTGQWERQTGPRRGTVIFMMYAGDVPMHCGVMLNQTECLHAHGQEKHGQVVVWKMHQVKKYLSRFYKLGTEPRVEFYKWVG